MSRPLVLAPSSPSSLLSHILAHHKYPTTILIGSPKQNFLEHLIDDVSLSLPPQDQQEPPSQDDHDHHHDQQPHPLLRAPLMQIATSRHIRIVFLPSVTHLRAYLSVFSTSDSKIQPPPNFTPSHKPPLLLAYGFLELHRHVSEWSTQGIGTSAAMLVECAARNSFKAVIAESDRVAGRAGLDGVLAEGLPLLNGATMRDDGSWAGRTVQVRRVLGRWFQFEEQSKVPVAT